MPPRTRSGTGADDEDNMSSQARFRPPATFTGADVKTTSDVTRFLFQLGLWFALSSIATADQVSAACSCLGGAALDWAISVHDSIATFESFADLLKKEFGPPNPSRAARTELWACIQTSSLAEYTSRFRAICLQVDHLSKEEQADRYLFGLKPHLRKELLARQADTFKEMTLLAASLDQSNTLSHITTTTTATPTTAAAAVAAKTYRAAALTAPTADSSTPTTDRVGPTRKGPLTPEIRAELLRLGGCFYCRQLGHLVANCPTKPPRPAPDQGNGPLQ